jgi:hypothetical protein
VKNLAKYFAKQYLRIPLLCLTLAACGHTVFAQVTFTAKAAQKVVGLSDVLEMDFVIDGASEADQFVPPSFSPFQVVQGPSYTSGMNMINGTTTKYYSITYFLKPSAVGKFTIGPASVRLGSQDIRSNSVRVEVVRGSTGASAAAPANPFQGMGGMGGMNMDPFSAPSREAYGDQFLKKNERAEDKIRHNMILKMSVSKTSCYVGEPIVATCKLYSRLESESRVEERPSFSGFSVFEMVQPEQGNVSQEVLGGRPFNAYLIRKSQLYPLQSGDLSIEQVGLDNTVTLYREGKTNRGQAPAGSVFDQMMRDFWGEGQTAGVPEKHQLNLNTDSLVIHVKPLPEAGKPADFSGAVGQFSLQASLTGISLKTNETDTLVLILSGKGNLPMINAPALHLPQGLESYDPSAKEELNQTVSPIQGRKTFQYIFTANKAGEFTLSPVVFSYFDPQTATYKTDSTAPLLLKVLPGMGNGNRNGAPVPGTETGSPWKWIWLVAGALLVFLVSGLVIFTSSRRKPTLSAKGAGDASAIPGATSGVPPGTPKENPSAGPVGSARASNPSNMPSPVASPLAEPDPHARYRPDFDSKVQQLSGAAVTTFEEKDWLEDARTQLKEQNSVAYYRDLNAGLWQFLQQRLELGGGERNKTAVMDRLEKKGFSPSVLEEVRQLLEECELALYAPVQTSSDMQRSFEMAERLQNRILHNLKD